VPEDERQARFVCEMALVFPDGRLLAARGELAGVIALGPRGTKGFGYDPVFFLPAYGATVAELDIAVKNRVSHRGRALEKLKEMLAASQGDFFPAPAR
jgi:XTP/dITP diphosphohydrolase